MGKVFIEEDSLTAIGNAIRNKTGGTDTLSVPSGMVEAINSITTGGGSGGGNIIVNNGVVKSVKVSNGNIKAGDLCTYSSLYPKYYQDVAKAAIPYNADNYFNAGGHYANYNYNTLREIIPLQDKHWLWSYVLNSTKYYCIGYFDENDDYVNVDFKNVSVSSTYDSMVIGAFDDGTIVMANGTSSQTDIYVYELNTKTHTLDAIGNVISSTNIPKLHPNTKCIELSKGYKYLILDYAYYSSSYDYTNYVIFTKSSSGTITKVKDDYIRYRLTSNSDTQCLLDVEKLSNGNIRMLNTYCIVDYSISNNTLSLIKRYTFANSGSYQQIARYDENMYLQTASDYVYLYKIDTDALTITEMDKVNSSKFTSVANRDNVAFGVGSSSILVTEDKRIILLYLNTYYAAIGVANIVDDKLVPKSVYQFPGKNSFGTTNPSGYKYYGQMDENTFYCVWGISGKISIIFFIVDGDGHVTFIDSDEIGRCFSSTETSTTGSSYMTSFSLYLCQSVSLMKTNISKLYKDGVFNLILPSSNSTSSSSYYDKQIIYKMDKDIITRGVGKFGVPALAIEDINDGEVGQAYVIK